MTDPLRVLAVVLIIVGIVVAVAAVPYANYANRAQLEANYQAIITRPERDRQAVSVLPMATDWYCCPIRAHLG